MIALLFFVSPGEKANKVPGAIDNLSAVSVVLGVGQYLKNNKAIIPKNTEIRLISFGCEEAGLRGAYRYAERHREELLKYDAQVFNMDGIQSPKNFYIIEYEPTTRTRHSAKIVEKMINAAELVGIKAKIGGAGTLEKIIGQISGGTDTTAFSKAKINAANLSSMELLKFVKFYHQPTDNMDMVNEEALTKALKICISYLINESKNN
jgi:Zn-dependent M28 family amino/carboxypeptidase